LNNIDIREKVNRFIESNFMSSKKITRLGADDSFLEKGVIDSAGVLELVGYIEKEFKISFLDTELVPDNLDSLAKISNFVAAKQQQGA
jgi:acyl carrier protein